MKPIRKLRDPTQGLAAYVEECTDGEASWEGFRNHAAGASYRELVESLTTLQRGLCGYCEIDLTETDRQVEHVIPRSDPDRGASKELNCNNMIACCLGGTARNLHHGSQLLRAARRRCSATAFGPMGLSRSSGGPGSFGHLGFAQTPTESHFRCYCYCWPLRDTRARRTARWRWQHSAGRAE